MYTALDIANWFIAYNNAEFRLNETVEYNVYERLIYSKLQMLLYLAQGAVSYTHLSDKQALFELWRYAIARNNWRRAGKLALQIAELPERKRF